MVSDSWETAQNLSHDVVVCQDHQEIKMEAEMSIFLDIHMHFEPGLVKKQHGREIPIGSHWSDFQHELYKL